MPPSERRRYTDGDEITLAELAEKANPVSLLVMDLLGKQDTGATVDLAACSMAACAIVLEVASELPADERAVFIEHAKAIHRVYQESLDEALAELAENPDILGGGG